MGKKLTKEQIRKTLRGKAISNKDKKFFNKPLSKYLKAENGIEGTMGGLTDIGFDYNGAWGGPSMAMGGGIPGTVGFTYARTQSPAPSNGPYAKKTKPSAQNGMEMKYYQAGLDFKPKTISKNGGWLEKYQEGGIIEDPMGQLAYPGEITRIPSNDITMQGVPYPVLGISDTGDTQLMQPGQDYTFDGNSVTEIPMMQKGGKAKKFLTEIGTAMMTSLGNPALAIPKMVEPTVDLAASTLAPYETVEQREDIFRRYRPIEYPNPVNIIRGLLYPDEQGKPGLDPQKDLNLGEEAWRKALDLPTKQKYIVPSKYKPSTAKDKNKEYYTLKDVIDPEKVIAEAKRQGWKPGAEYQMESLKPLIQSKDFSWSKDFSDIDPLQRFKLSIDPKGEYVSIYDVYDFDFPGVNKMIKPYEFYDRFYLPKTKSTKKKQNGGWLNKYE